MLNFTSTACTCVYEGVAFNHSAKWVLGVEPETPKRDIHSQLEVYTIACALAAVSDIP